MISGFFLPPLIISETYQGVSICLPFTYSLHYLKLEMGGIQTIIAVIKGPNNLFNCLAIQLILRVLLIIENAHVNDASFFFEKFTSPVVVIMLLLNYYDR